MDTSQGSPAQATAIAPGKGVGPFGLGATLHSVLSFVKSQPNIYKNLGLIYDKESPLNDQVIVHLPLNGLRLRFDGVDQRLRMIEVIDFTRTQFSFRGQELLKFSSGENDEVQRPIGDAKGPTFHKIYSKLFGPTFQGEYIGPRTTDLSVYGLYVLSYPGISFSFPVKATSYSPQADFVSLLNARSTLPAKALCVFSGASWPEARKSLFSPLIPRSLPASLPQRSDKLILDELDFARIHDAGRIELLLRQGESIWIKLGETSPQDLISDIGPPEAIYRKNDRRMSIHRARSPAGSRSRSSQRVRVGSLETTIESDQSSAHAESDSEEDDSDGADSKPSDASSECFWNYFSLGFDLYLSAESEPRSIQTLKGNNAGAVGSGGILTVTKMIIHGNVPNSYPFNRHRRLRWILALSALENDSGPLNSENRFKEITTQLRYIFKDSYADAEDERWSQQGMVLNRDWGNSPGSSCELLGGFEETGKRQGADGLASEHQTLGNTELFGFPGLVFEVLKSDIVSCLTIY